MLGRTIPDVTAGSLGVWALRGGVVACVVALVCSLAGAGAVRGVPDPMRAACTRWGTRALTAALALVAVAAAVLVRALLLGDFTLAYVADTTSRATPTAYRLAGLWSGMDGSLLWWELCLLGLGLAGVGTARRRLGPRVVPVTQAVVAALGACFVGVSATLADPFERLAIPAIDGQGLTAILQHPAMLYHPTLLYLGLVALVVPMALTVGACTVGALDAPWLAAVRRWTLAGWSTLAVGMLAGARWAYVELGWGGFWAWDPVENAALIPWLGATAVLHGAMVQERTGRLGRWNAACVGATGTLAVLGAYLTRSGTAASVHAFALSQAIGRVLLVGVAVTAAVVTVAVVVARRRGAGDGRWEPDIPLRREGVLLLGAVAVLAATCVVLVGTAAPVAVELLADDVLAIEGDFFTRLGGPVALVVLVLAAVGPFLGWERWHGGARPRLGMGATVACLATATALATGGGWRPAVVLGAAAGLVATSAVGVGAVAGGPAARRRVGGAVAHAGLGLLLLGAAGGALGTSAEAELELGETLAIDGRLLRFEGLTSGRADRYEWAEAELTWWDGDERVATFRPQVRAYEQQPLPTPEAALRSTVRGDVIVSLRQVDRDGAWVRVEVFTRPLAWCVWVGGLLLAAGGVLAARRSHGDGATSAPPAAPPRRAATAPARPAPATRAG
jgi:cytochrome c-type biogenesis protein CcmF